MSIKFRVTIALIWLCSLTVFSQGEPLGIGVVGITHTYVYWVLGDQENMDIKIVGVIESREDLARGYLEQY